MKILIFLSLAALASLNNNFKDLKEIPGIQIDLRYATANNFVGQNLYGNFREAKLHRLAFDKLKKANELLHRDHPELQLHVFDALRPLSVQKILFAKVAGTDQEKYVADPATGSVHNYGFAVDLTLANAEGHELDMGTGFDNFTPLAQPRFEEKMLKSGKLTSKQIENRLILRAAMLGAGFKIIPNEWWHFDALPIEELKAHFKLVE